MFNLEKHDARITNINFRKEKHGAEAVPACDITLNIKASALLLDTIDPKLRKAFFEKPGKGEQQTLPIDGNNLTALAIPYLKEQKLQQKYEAFEVEIGSLLEHIESIFFTDAKVTIENVTFIEGGSIDLSLKASFLIEESDDAPLLATWRRGEVKLTLTPPSAQGEASDGGDDQKKAA